MTRLVTGLVSLRYLPFISHDPWGSGPENLGVCKDCRNWTFLDCAMAFRWVNNLYMHSRKDWRDLYNRCCRNPVGNFRHCLYFLADCCIGSPKHWYFGYGPISLWTPRQCESQSLRWGVERPTLRDPRHPQTMARTDALYATAWRRITRRITLHHTSRSSSPTWYAPEAALAVPSTVYTC